MGIANHERGGNTDSDVVQLASPVRWRGPDGAEVLAAFADSYTQLRLICGEPPTIPGMARSLAIYVDQYDRPDYLPQDLPIVGTHLDNEDLADGYADLVERWNNRYEFPTMRFSTVSDYLGALGPLRDRLPVICGDGGSYWEDAVGTQTAAIARYRSAQALLPAAETLLALTSAHYPGVRPDTTALDRGWDGLLVGCEHTWTAAHATSRPHAEDVADQLDWKLQHIRQAWRTARDEGRRGLSQLGELLAARAPGLLVVNPAYWRRDLVVETELPAGTRVLDGDLELPAEPLGDQVDGYHRIRMTVADVPPFGYRLLRLADAPAAQAAPLYQPLPETVQTARYTVTVDNRARIVGLRHRATGRELLDQNGRYALGELVYVSGGGDATGRGLGAQATSINDAGPYLPRPQLTTTPARMHAVGTRPAPDGQVIVLEGDAPTLPHIRTELRLFDHTDRVELTVALRKQAELAKESVYLAFPFAADHPALRYDRHLGWTQPATDGLPGACSEWFCLQNGASVTGTEGSITWASADAPLFTAGEMVSGRWPTSFEPANGHLFSWVMNNYWFTNTPASQSGDVVLRYALWPDTQWDPATATCRVRDFRTPALTGEVRQQDNTRPRTARLPAPAGALLDVDLPSNVDARLFAGRIRAGLLIRLEETAGGTAAAAVRQPVADGRGYLCNAVEVPLQPLTPDAAGWYRMDLKPHEVMTLLLAAPDHPSPPERTTVRPVPEQPEIR